MFFRKINKYRYTSTLTHPCIVGVWDSKFWLSVMVSSFLTYWISRLWVLVVKLYLVLFHKHNTASYHKVSVCCFNHLNIFANKSMSDGLFFWKNNNSYVFLLSYLALLRCNNGYALPWLSNSERPDIWKPICW